APFTYHGGSQVIFSTPQVGGSTVHVQSVPANNFMNMLFYSADRVTIGSIASGVGGSLAGVRGGLGIQTSGPADIVLDDSGNTDTTPKRVTLSQFLAGQIPVNRIDALTGSSITWRLAEGSSLTIRGGAADETFAIKGITAPPALRIDGGVGTNTLDYSAYDLSLAGVTVNLVLGTATGLRGIANIKNVIG